MPSVSLVAHSTAARRIHQVLAHLSERPSSPPARSISSCSTVASEWTLREVELHDTAAAWAAAGFHVESDCVAIGDLQVRLKNHPRAVGLSRLLLGSPTGAAIVVTAATAAVAEERGHEGAQAGALSENPNTCRLLGELVLYAQDLRAFVAALDRVGLATDRNRGIKQQKGSAHAVATYYLYSVGGAQLRLLVFGPIDPASPASANPDIWMLGRGDGPLELTGWLPVVRDMAKLSGSIGPRLGEPKKALQKDRTIATLKRGAIAGLTGTFAFLSDGDAPLF